MNLRQAVDYQDALVDELSRKKNEAIDEDALECAKKVKYFLSSLLNAKTAHASYSKEIEEMMSIQ